MPNDDSLLVRLKARERHLDLEAAGSDRLQTDSTLRRISDADDPLTAVKAVADEETWNLRASL